MQYMINKLFVQFNETAINKSVSANVTRQKPSENLCDTRIIVPFPFNYNTRIVFGDITAKKAEKVPIN